MKKSAKLRVLDCNGDLNLDKSDLVEEEEGVLVVPRAGLEVMTFVLHTSCGYPRVGLQWQWPQRPSTVAEFVLLFVLKPKDNATATLQRAGSSGV
jgi:hypothetical protein